MSEERSTSVNIFYTVLETNLLGNLWLAATEKGLVTIRFNEDSAQFLASLLLEMNLAEPPNLIHDQTKLQPYTANLIAYLDRKKPISKHLPVDLSDQTPFQQEILTLLREIPFGAIQTYGELAAATNNPNAARAIGQVLRRNPIPIIIPCHRVLNADGTLGGYGGIMGSERKIALLKHEGVILA